VSLLARITTFPSAWVLLDFHRTVLLNLPFSDLSSRVSSRLIFEHVTKTQTASFKLILRIPAVLTVHIDKWHASGMILRVDALDLSYGTGEYLSYIPWDHTNYGLEKMED
jgi:hypothetical protein